MSTHSGLPECHWCSEGATRQDAQGRPVCSVPCRGSKRQELEAEGTSPYQKVTGNYQRGAVMKTIGDSDRRLVQQVASRMYENDYPDSGWATAPEAKKDDYRFYARAALGIPASTVPWEVRAALTEGTDE